MAGCVCLTQPANGAPGGLQPRTIDYIATGRAPPFIPILDPDAPPKPKQVAKRRRGRPEQSGGSEKRPSHLRLEPRISAVAPSSAPA
jgi:hypothetical protein